VVNSAVNLVVNWAARKGKEVALPAVKSVNAWVNKMTSAGTRLALKGTTRSGSTAAYAISAREPAENLAKSPSLNG